MGFITIQKVVVDGFFSINSMFSMDSNNEILGTFIFNRICSKVGFSSWCLVSGTRFTESSEGFQCSKAISPAGILSNTLEVNHHVKKRWFFLDDDKPPEKNGGS